MMDNNMGGKNVCGCPHHKMGPTALVIFGLVFLLGNLNILTASAVSMIWPIILIVAGLMKMKSGSCKCC